MNKIELERVILDCCNDILFTYNELPSGVTSTVDDYTPTFQAWHGSKTKEYSSAKELLGDKFFSGKSLADLAGSVSFSFA